MVVGDILWMAPIKNRESKELVLHPDVPQESVLGIFVVPSIIC